MRIAAVFDILAIHDIGMHRAELGDDICSLPVEQHLIYFASSLTSAIPGAMNR